MKSTVKFRKALDELQVEADSWLTLGALRELVAEADARGWSDKSLINHSRGTDHPFRHGIECARRIVIEGGSTE